MVPFYRTFPFLEYYKNEDEYEIELNLKNNTGFYKTIEGNFILEPKLIKYDNLDTLTIIYELNGQTFKFNIEVVE